MASVTILIPTCRRPAALAVTLTSLISQTFKDFDIVVSDQTDDANPYEAGEVRAAARVLEAHGHRVSLLRHLPRRGIAEHRQYLLDRAGGPLALYLDDDLILEPTVVERLVRVICEQECGFVGMAPVGLSYRDDVRPHEQVLEPWDGRVEPETVMPGTVEWQRYRLHNAANCYHVQRRLGLGNDDLLVYKVAWVGGCTLYDVWKLRSVGGFGFWMELPQEHCGEDVLAQLLVARKYGGCGVLPSGVYHQELETTVPDRRINAPVYLSSLLSP
ncbi:MAG TPA: glycosyltransferase family A protein [Dehalococcoidia bacterium]|nr:glycosyltransferase family A protein [Dehalococcoidia bacterium]